MERLSRPKVTCTYLHLNPFDSPSTKAQSDEEIIEEYCGLKGNGLDSIVQQPLEPIREFVTDANAIGLADQKPIKSTEASCFLASVLMSKSAALALEKFHTA
ncbi:hypothetical protein J6590_069673 [Homalodisca vitripennis]|nr:hypothetical protein J6590_069673 [Homalodisca vitripennis]